MSFCQTDGCLSLLYLYSSQILSSWGFLHVFIIQADLIYLLK